MKSILINPSTLASLAHMMIVIPVGTAGLDNSREIAISANWLYAGNKGTNEILRFDLTTGAPDPNGAFVSSGDNGLQTPRGLVFDTAGNLYFSSNGTDQILKYDPAGNFLGFFAPNFSFHVGGIVTDTGTQLESVSFYRDANGSGMLEAGTDTLLGTDSDSAGGWSVSVGIPGNFAIGSYTYFAQGTFNGGTPTNIATTTGDVIKKGSKPPKFEQHLLSIIVILFDRHRHIRFDIDRYFDRSTNRPDSVDCRPGSD